MERHGFIRDILDVKVLILFVMARIDAPADADTIYALCFQDDCLSYFDVKEALPQLVQDVYKRQDILFCSHNHCN